MSPGLLTSELGLSFPPLTQQKRMDESIFPPIARKSAISLNSETDPNDYCNQLDDRRIHTRGSVPASLSSSPIKFPTIDRANSTSVASLPGSRSTRHRPNMRELRSSYCRSPSCPSHLDANREFNHPLEYDLIKSDRGPRTDAGSVDDDMEDSFSKLPSIFSKDCGGRLNMDGKGARGRDKSRDRLSHLSLRRSESFMRTLSHPTAGSTTPPTNRDNEPRQSQATALLLPIRTNPQNNKKKKKRRSRDDSDGETAENTPRNCASNEYGNRLSLERENEEALNAIARENDMYDDDIDTTPRAIEISSSRKVKQWINSNQKEAGQIKA